MEEKMKRTKLLLSTVVSLLLALVMVFAVACNPSGGTNQGSVRPAPEVPEKPAGDLGITQGSGNETKSLLGIEIAVYPKTEYQIGETFDSEGISVRATYLDSTIAPDPLDPNANLVRDFVSATVDSSNFDSSKVGVYTIYVSYTYLGVTRMTSYTVSVAPATPAYGGIVAKLATGKSDTYSLSAGSTSVTINKDILAVYAIGTDGEPEETALDAELYDADLYLGTKKITDNAATENGVYSFVATLKADKSQQDFIPVYVVNTVSSIELIEGVGTFEQVEGKDTISSTWTFKVTYSNGSTKTVKAGDAGLTIELDTTVVGEGKTANVKYAEKDAKGTSHEVTTTVTYKITEKPATGGTVTHNYSLNITELQAAIKARVQNLEGGNPNNNNAAYVDGDGNLTDKIALDPSDFTGANAFITMLAGYSKSDQYRTSNNGIIEIKGERLQVTFEGTGSISVSFASTGSGNDSNFGIKKNGNYLTADTDGTTATLVAEGDDAGAYTVNGTSYVTVVYTITQPGIYTLCSNLSARGCRISTITMQDVVEGQGGGEEKPADPLVINISSLVTAGTLSATTYSAETALASDDNTTVSLLADASNTVAIDTNNKSIDGYSFTHRLKLSGAGSNTARSIKMELSGAVKITVYGLSSSSTATSGDRTLGIFQGVKTEDVATNTWAAVGETQDILAGSSILKLEFEVSAAGTYYFAAVSGGFNVYGIVITPV